MAMPSRHMRPRHAIEPRTDNLDETLLFINGVYCPRPADTEWCFSQEYSFNELMSGLMRSKADDQLNDAFGLPAQNKTLGDVLDTLSCMSMKLTLTRGDKVFETTVKRVTSFRAPSGLHAINLEIDFDTHDAAERELLSIRAARLALAEGKDAGGQG